ncbi:sugar phosphotransferase [Streptomyces antnestii]|uniref:Sugar phosphotransferase n=1 Tax=Streptomyces antnestii TaxID=2494256 RepID=A0A3S2VLQ8_9ACTN|nr:stealth family protein [Streptomyces sp. San01]RVU28988.1 sugar phosphotransferase [Streptomyces sp. San01]
MPPRIQALGERMLPARIRNERAGRRASAQAAAAERKRQEQIAARRCALLESDGDVRTVTVEGRTLYGRVVHTFTAAGASAHNLELVSDALEHSGIEYFLVPGRSRTRHVVGMRHGDRKRLLVALRQMYGSSPLYAMRPGSDPLPQDAVLYADGALPKDLKRQDTIRFGELLLGPDGQLLADLGFGCDVEFWHDGAKVMGSELAVTLRTQPPQEVLADSLVAPRLNSVTDVLPKAARVPAARKVAGREHPTYADFLQPRMDTVDFPIDVVYTWVDGSDPELRARRESYRVGKPRIHARETGASRYTSHDELKYSLRSLDMYAPFVRNVYVVTDGQTPAWLNPAAAGIQIVDHKDIFADPTALPVFNSHAVETQLHHITGLSERYLYFNDDFFLGRPVTAGHFFHGNGVAKIPFSPFQLGLGEPHPDEPAPNSAGKNVRRLLFDAHGRFTTNKFMHTPQPQIRAVMEEAEERFAEDVARTSSSRFRSVTDIAMTASLHHHHAYLTGRAVPGKYNLRYIDVAHPDASAGLAELARTRRYDFFCLNDVNTPESEQERITTELRTFLESYFPFPSRFEG